jgi:hypothetical protein
MAIKKTINCYSQKVIPLAFDESMSYLEDIACLKAKINEVITFVNDVIDEKITEYIDERFNDIMLDAMYDASTETLVLYISHEENS